MAQPSCTVHTFGLKDGLSTSVVSEVEEDQNGLIWLASVNGLSFYDGYSFHSLYGSSKGFDIFRANRMLRVDFDSDNNLWCNTVYQRIYRYDTHSCVYTDILDIIFDGKVPPLDLGKHYKGAKGYMWIMLKQGKKQYVYKVKNSIASKKDARLVAVAALESDAEVKHITTDSRQNEWIIFPNSLIKYNDDNSKSKRYQYNKVFGTATHTLLYNNKTKALGLYQDKTGKVLTVSIGGLDVNSVVETAKGYLLLGTNEGIFKLNCKTLKAENITGAGSELNIEVVYTDSRGRVWGFCDNGKLVLVDGKSVRLVTERNDNQFMPTLSENDIFFEDNSHNIWLAPKNQAFGYYDELLGEIVPYKLSSQEAPFFTLGEIHRCFKKGDNCMWLVDGHTLLLLTFKPYRFQFTHLEDNQEVRALALDKRGRIWMGSDMGKVAVMDKHGSKPIFLGPDGKFTAMPKRLAGNIRSLYCDDKERIWIGTRGDGILIYENGHISRISPTEDGKGGTLNNGNVYDFMQLSDGRMLVATYGGGLNIATKGKSGWIFANNSNGLLNYPKRGFNKMRRISRTKKGVILASTTDGIITFDGSSKTIKRFYRTTRIEGDTTSLLSSDVMCVLPEADGTVYVASRSGGLQKIISRNLLADNLKLTKSKGVNVSEGVMLSIIDDNAGHLWVVREQSIDRVSKNGHQVGVFTTNEPGQRLVLTECASVYDASTGKLYLGALGGLAVANIKAFSRNSDKSSIVFTNVMFQGDDRPRMLLNADKLDVPSDKRSLTISFAALDYDDHSNIHYAYMLEGVDKGWNYTPYGNSASYNNLPAGTFTFRVKSTDNNDIWQDNERTITIHVEPVFAETVWAKLLLLLLILIVGWGLLSYWNGRKQLQLDRKMTKLRNDFYSEIGHQLRTPLALIGSPVTEVLRTATLGDTERKMLEMVQRNARKMLDLVNRLLNYDKADNYLVDDNNAPVFSNFSEVEESEPQQDTKLLVVEDNDDLRSFLKSILSSTYQVVTARNGQEGLEKASTEAPDFIITDVMMPVMDGMTMVHKLKQDPNTSHIPVIILSAKASMSDRLEGLREGVDDYITKPFSAKYLKVRVENILSRRRLMQQSLLGKIDKVPAMTDVEMPQIVDSDKVMIEKLTKFIENNISDSDLKVDDLASAVCLGRTVFNDKMKSLVGLTPNRFLIHVRLERAKYLIVNSQFTFSEIAGKVGFSDSRYFSKCFKREVGLTPSEYRDQKQGQEQQD